MIDYLPTCLQLPLYEIPEPYSGKSQKLRQRVNRRRLVLSTANACLNSLNALSTSLNSSVSDVYSVSSGYRVKCVPASSNTASMYIPAVYASHSPSFNAAQVSRTVHYVYAASKLFVYRAHVGGGDVSSATEHHVPSYSDAASLAVPLVADKVALPEAAGVVQLLDLLPEDIARKFAAPSDDLVVDSTPSVRTTGALMCSSSEYRKLIIRMMKAGMLSFTLTPKCVNGLFCVPKDGDALRLIINAQPANTLFASPPHVELPTPDLITNLVLDQAAQMYVAKVDISNYYHQLALPEWMWPYFALPAVSASDLGLSQFGSDIVYPCCKTLPMGFSWSVFLAQQAHEHMIYTSTSLRPEDAIARTTDGLVNRTRHSVYIDDMSFFSLDQLECRRLQLEYMDACQRWKLPVKMSKVVEPSCRGVDVVGVEVDGIRHTVGVSAAKLSALINDTLHLLNSGFASGKQVERLVGRWSWAFLCRRPAFSAFSAVYRFIAVAGRSIFAIWKSVVNELLAACGLAPILHTYLAAPVLPRLVACDASSAGQGVVAAKVPASVVTSVTDGLSWAPHESVLTASPTSAGEGPNKSYLAESAESNDDDAAMPDQELHDITEYVRLNTKPAARSVPSRIGRLLGSQHWPTIVASPWRTHEHINVKEMRACATAVRWVASLPSAASRRVVLLTDSAVAAAVLSKGRSSAFNILRVSRFISAVLLASDIQLLTRWIPSDWNPADAPSRLFE